MDNHYDYGYHGQRLLIHYNIMSESIGAIGVSGMIWAATILTLGSLALCWFTSNTPHATILQNALQYPYTIIFRIGMMYSLFIYFLELLFIKWWIDSLPVAKHTKRMVIFGTIGLISYGLFVACIDRKKINYMMANASATTSGFLISYTIYNIMNNLQKNRSQGYALANEDSWFYKKIFSTINFAGTAVGGLILLGFLDINLVYIIEYVSVISASLFFWTFSLDFKKFKMDVQKIEKPSINIIN